MAADRLRLDKPDAISGGAALIRHGVAA